MRVAVDLVDLAVRDGAAVGLARDAAEPLDGATAGERGQRDDQRAEAEAGAQVHVVAP